MDTDNLSIEAYKGIIIEAEKFSHGLALLFGVLASDCKDEKEYLKDAEQLISEIRTLDEEELIDLFFGNLPDTKSLKLAFDRITANIDLVREIPKKQRHYEL